MNFKRVVAFFDMFDEIPENAKYLFSRRVETPVENAEEGKASEILSNNPKGTENSTAVIFVHYYEVESMDFDELMQSEFPRKNSVEKMKDFFHKYKIPLK